jgi:large subunit ribosomal protein L15
LPKRGFFNHFALTVCTVNVSDLERFDAGTAVDEIALRQARLVQGVCDKIKVLGDGDLTKALTVTVHAFSKSAAEKIERAGGKAVVLASEITETPAQ